MKKWLSGSVCSTLATALTKIFWVKCLVFTQQSITKGCK